MSPLSLFAQQSDVLERSLSGGFRGAIIGALVGAAIGVILYVLKKAKG